LRHRRLRAHALLHRHGDTWDRRHLGWKAGRARPLRLRRLLRLRRVVPRLHPQHQRLGKEGPGELPRRVSDVPRQVPRIRERVRHLLLPPMVRHIPAPKKRPWRSLCTLKKNQNRQGKIRMPDPTRSPSLVAAKSAAR